MKNLRKSYIYGLMLLSSLGIGSCTSGFDNQDPSGVTTEEAGRDGYRLKKSFQEAGEYIVPINANTNQFTDCLLGGSFGGYLADSNAGFNGKNYATYNPEEHWIQVMFNDIITNIYKSRKTIRELTDDPQPLAASNIMYIMAAQRVTDTYGPIPYSKIGQDGSLIAPYDSQEEVYNAMFNELEEAIETLTSLETADFSELVDDVYGGKVVQWIKLANSVKLRMAMRISDANPTLAKQKAEEAVNHKVGVMTAASDNAYKPVYKENPFWVVTEKYNNGDSHMSADLASYMNGYNDPRREKYFKQADFSDPTMPKGYQGIRSGILIPNSDYIKQFSKMNVLLLDKVLWMNASEVAFLRAEGALKGWNMQGTAEDFYNEGIKLSFEQWGATDVDAYTADATSTPLRYSDPLKGKGLGDNSYKGSPSTITIKWDNSATEDQKLERIITQKWIANFPLGLEAWSDFRRTGYPKLMEVVVNNSGGKVDSKRMARRLPYPQAEYSENGANVQAAIQMLGGPDNMGTDVWWAKKK